MVTGDLLHDDSLVLRVITHLVADVRIRALPRGSFVGTFGHGHVVDVLLVAVGCYHRPDGRDPMEVAVRIRERAFTLLLIVLTPSNAPNCRGSKRGTHRPQGWHTGTCGDKIGPSYLTPAFSGAQK